MITPTLFPTPGFDSIVNWVRGWFSPPQQAVKTPNQTSQPKTVILSSPAEHIEQQIKKYQAEYEHFKKLCDGQKVPPADPFKDPCNQMEAKKIRIRSYEGWRPENLADQMIKK
jgi:hypothetical protein